MKKTGMILFVLIYFQSFLFSQNVYPSNWWVGMKNQQLQLMIHHKDIANIIPMYKLPATGIKLAEGITLKAVHRVENPNYIFADLIIDKNAKPGTRNLSFTKPGTPFTIKYELKARSKENGKTRIQGITSKDFIYLMIPDRFANGDPSNDIIDGYRDRENDKKNMFSRHGGDFKGIQSKFDYFNQLGVTALWLTPIIENNTDKMREWGNDIAGYHGYWFTDHYEVDKRLGGNEGYLEFCNDAHKKGIKVIQDAVYNHVSKQHWFVLDPPTRDWINNWPVFTGPNHREETLFDPYASEYDKKLMLDGWFIDHLPDLNQRNPFLANFLVQHAIWTTEYFGIDGWRVDTYKYCDEAFLNRVNKALETEYPGITIFGEAWVNTPIANAYFTQNNMNIPFKHNANSVIDFQVCFAMLAGMGLSQDGAGGVNKLYTTMAQDLVYKNPMRNCIFLDNHDMDRVFSSVDDDWGKLKIGLTWLLTIRGIPQLYYGTEVLMKNKKTGLDGASVREDFPGGWSSDTVSKFNAKGRNDKENETFNYISILANYRKRSSALTTGKTTQFVPVDGVYTFFRYDTKQTVMVVVNTSNKAAKPNWESYAERTKGFTTTRDVVSGRTILFHELELPPKSCFVVELLK
ncbi:MAG TPA: alpha-amylase family glycosyl hydrolase [Chitinophagaceae bacterium]